MINLHQKPGTRWFFFSFFLLFLLFFIPTPVQAKKVRVRDPFTARNEKVDTYTKEIAKRLESGKIGYIGTKAEALKIRKKLYKYYKNIPQKSLNRYIEVYRVSFSQYKSDPYWQKKYTIPEKYCTVSSEWFAQVKAGSWPQWEKMEHAYTISMDKKMFKTRKKYWKLATKAVKKAGVRTGMSDKKAVKKITKWLCKHTRYKITGGMNSVNGVLFRKGVGQCADYSDAFWAMCTAAGIKCKEYYGYVPAGYHAWNKVKIGKKWYWIDVCWADGYKGHYDKKYDLSRKLWKDHKKPKDTKVHV